MPRVTDPALLAELDHNIEDDWGPGARELPNGSVVRYGPRGGTTILRAAGGDDATSIKLTEDQGKSAQSAGLMVNAERSYDRARRQGYDPGSGLNAFASVLEGLPFGGLDGLGAAVRNDVGDRGRQAELQWSDAQLRSISGAAAPESEVKRNVRTYFPRPGENAFAVGPQKRQARATAFSGVKTRAGPVGNKVGDYPRGDIPPAARETHERLFKAGRIVQGKPYGQPDNPYLLTDMKKADRLPKGSYAITPDGHYGIIE